MYFIVTHIFYQTQEFGKVETELKHWQLQSKIHIEIVHDERKKKNQSPNTSRVCVNLLKYL